MLEKDIDYNLELARGKAYEQAVSEWFKEEMGFDIGLYETRKEQWEIGESKARIEIKYDARSLETGNLYIEVEEKRSRFQEHYNPSGIYRQDNSLFYLIGNHQEFFLIRKGFLRKLYEEGGFKDLPIRTPRPTDTSKGYLIPIKTFKQWLYKHKEEDIALHFKPCMALANGLPRYTDQQREDMQKPEKPKFLAFAKTIQRFPRKDLTI